MCKNILCPDPSCAVAYTSCHCGCGSVAPPLKTHIPGRNYIAGNPALYIPGHQVRKPAYGDAPERLWSRVALGGPDACWEWQGPRAESGHGKITHATGRGTMNAHRLAWELTKGAIPDGLEVCHNCPDGDNPACCNPSHLFLDTHEENIKDMWRKGRGRPHNRVPITDGEKEIIRDMFAGQGRSLRQIAAETGHDRRTIWDAVDGLAPERRRASILGPETVRTIRKRLEEGDRVNALAREYGVTHATISHIKHRKVFAHL